MLVGALWFRKRGEKKTLLRTPRRTLFELHAGRQILQLPFDLVLETMSSGRSGSEVRFTTSEDLIAALGPMGPQYVDLQQSIDKVNLSYVRNPMLLVQNREEAIREARHAEREAKIARKEPIHRITLKDLLIQYLRHVDPILEYQARLKNPNSPCKGLDDALLELFNEDNTRFLGRRGWDVTDLMNWTWVLTSETTERAATRLLAIAHQGFPKLGDGMLIPQFVFLFLLRRRNPSAEALRSLLIYAWELMEKSESLLEPLPPLEKLADDALQGKNLTNTRVVKSAEDDPLGMNGSVFMIMVIRLLRSARTVWPAACDNIVALVNRYLDGVNFRAGASQMTTLTSEDTTQLTYMYNTLLKLVSLPASTGPFQSAFYQQRAQFSLLRRMNQFQPPLIVDRRGYRAVVSMQLRHKKTLKEREWAQMKAKSWPPWKEEKLGIDANISVEHGTSRAMEAMRRSWEAGYGPDNWDIGASILAGWDTDGSPTIQTRAVYLPHDPHERRTEDAQIWVARIRSTRTLNEAWSCFLSYKDQEFRSGGAFYVYHQMFEKIVQDAKRPPAENIKPSSTDFPDEQPPLPGDGLEVLPAPESPREAVYVRRPPPNIDEFVELMAEDKIRPDKKFLSTMLTNAPTLEAGLQYLEASAMPNEHVLALSGEKSPSTPKAQAALVAIPPYLFSAFIRLLTRFPPRMPYKDRPSEYALAQTGSVLDSMMEKTESAQLALLQSSSGSRKPVELAPPVRSIVINPLLKAIQLVLARKPRYRPAWYNLFRALSSPRVVIDVVSKFVDQDYQDIKTWQMTCGLLNEMLEIDQTLDLEGFQILCAGLEKAIFASERLSRNPRIRRGDNGPRDDMRSYVDRVLLTGLPLLKEIFKDVVRSKTMQEAIPVSLTEEKSNIDASIEEHGVLESDDTEKDTEKDSMTESRAFLPPGCLLPRLLEVPHPACLHGFIRILGLRRDYDGILDLVEWMSLFADDINAVADEKANWSRMMRRCLTAIHVFMERSWIILEKREAEAQGEDPSTVRDELEMKAEPAPAGVVRAIQEIVRQNKRWGGWPMPHNVMQYCANGKFI
ncbi:hypothetical protein HO173_006190 [Letharia columbiana]|uniref:Uncharacterized protein n=1 Tax=Letharia columbiana TaxID=112416 RepID=A0A8H6FVJ3_9LECA|nr:uncharacterized protein HO173_006190 [Letharia columbiana]KAF6235507.1 hypothetical protein HO173_006190 [Letharia columbiana]